MRKQESKEICGTTYHVTQLGARKGTEVLLMLKGIVANHEKGMAGMLEAVSSEVFFSVADTMAKYTEFDTVVGNKPARPRLDQVFDDHFAGRYDAMFEWLVFALQVNFADFTNALPELLQRLVAGGKANPTNPPSEKSSD